MKTRTNWAALLVPSKISLHRSPALFPNLCAWEIERDTVTLWHLNDAGECQKTVADRRLFAVLTISTTYNLETEGRVTT